MGTVEPFWHGDKGVLLFKIGFPMVFLGSIVYCGFLFWGTNKLSTQRKVENRVVGVCGFVGGAEARDAGGPQGNTEPDYRAKELRRHATSPGKEPNLAGGGASSIAMF